MECKNNLVEPEFIISDILVPLNQEYEKTNDMAIAEKIYDLVEGYLMREELAEYLRQDEKFTATKMLLMLASAAIPPSIVFLNYGFGKEAEMPLFISFIIGLLGIFVVHLILSFFYKPKEDNSVFKFYRQTKNQIKDVKLAKEKDAAIEELKQKFSIQARIF